MNFFEKVYANVKKIPRGKVATYGQIAALAGSPRAARQVGWALASLPHGTDVPWQRVINARGMVSIENLKMPKEELVRRLQNEGVAVEFKDGNYWVDLKRYLWQPD